MWVVSTDTDKHINENFIRIQNIWSCSLHIIYPIVGIEPINSGWTVMITNHFIHQTTDQKVRFKLCMYFLFNKPISGSDSISPSRRNGS